MKKILFVSERLQVNGAAKSLLALLKAISSDYEVSLFLFAHNGDMMSEVPKNVCVLPELEEYRAVAGQMKRIVSESLKKGKLALAWFRLRIFCERALHRPFTQWNKLPEIKGDWDIVCAYADGFISSVVINKIPAGKKVLWVHEDYEHDMKPSEVLNSFLSADAIAGVSNDAIQHLRNIVGHEIDGKTHVVHNIIDPVKVQQQSTCEEVALQGKGCSLISVGRLSREKGYDLIPAILELLVKEKLDVCWYIIGDGPESYKTEILTDAKKRGVSDRIYFLGARSNPHPYTRRADCFVQLSQHEGWCMTISEALSLGVPVVVSDLQVFHEQVSEGENGLFAHDEKSFAEAISQILRHEIVLPGSNNFPFTPDKVVNEFNDVIESLS